MSSILGGHFQGRPTKTHVKHMIHAQCMWSLHIDPGDKAPFGAIPGHKHIGRLYHERRLEEQWVRDGARGAEAWFAHDLPRMRQSPFIHIWQKINEIPDEDEAQAHQSAQFERRGTELMHEAGLRTGAYAWGTGHPQIKFMPIYAAGLLPSVPIIFHAYSMETSMIPEYGHTLRHRLVAQAFVDAGYPIPMMLGTEGGLDFKGRKDLDGWKARGVTSPQYVEGLARIAQAMQQDSYVLCWLIFGYVPLDWDSFLIDDETSWRLAQLMAAQNVGGTSPVIPEPASVEARILADALPTAWAWNEDHAFPKYVAGRGWQLRGEEYTVTIDGVDHRYQVFADVNGELRVVYAVVGEWGKVTHVEAGT